MLRLPLNAESTVILFSGAHKERFDEDGKGKGKDGREYTTENDGYVTGYKDKGTYDDKK